MMKPVMQDLSRFRLPRDFRGRSAIYVQLWWIIQATVFRMSPQFMYGLRRAILRAFGAKVGRNALIRPTVRIQYPWKVSIGDHSWIGDNAELYSLGEIAIGANAVVSQRAYLCTGSHDLLDEAFAIYAKPIHVEDEAWVAAGAFIHPGVRIGRGAVIGACAVLKTDAVPYAIYIGNPAKLVKMRDVSGQSDP